jgi:hypothetical protein
VHEALDVVGAEDAAEAGGADDLGVDAEESGDLVEGLAGGLEVDGATELAAEGGVDGDLVGEEAAGMVEVAGVDGVFGDDDGAGGGDAGVGGAEGETPGARGAVEQGAVAAVQAGGELVVGEGGEDADGLADQCPFEFVHRDDCTEVVRVQRGKRPDGNGFMGKTIIATDGSDGHRWSCVREGIGWESVAIQVLIRIAE